MSRPDAAAIFAALGDPTRLVLLDRLHGGDGAVPVTTLCADLPMTRQAVSRHLRVLHAAGLVDLRRQGRQTLCAPVPGGLAQARRWLAEIGATWDDTLVRLRRAVEG